MSAITDDIRIMRVSNGWVIDLRGNAGREHGYMLSAAVAETPQALTAWVREWAEATIVRENAVRNAVRDNAR